MLTKTSGALAASCLLLAASAADAKDDKWSGAQILPASASIRLVVGGQVVGGVHDIHWPATVERHNGQWLWISDREGYNSHHVAGWVSTSDILKFDSAQSFFTDRLRQNPTATDFWLRGIYWENHSEPVLAMADYIDALALDANLADAELRLGRIEADRSPADHAWEKRFIQATTLAGSRPRVFFDWGEALTGSYEKTGAEKDYDDAKKQFLAAVAYDRQWPAGYLGLGQLQLARGQRLQKVGQDATPALHEAVGYFCEVIRLNPEMFDAYTSRAKASQLAHDLPEARRSAHKACELTDYRNPESLEVLAAVYADQGMFERAAYYANKSAEYVAEERRHEMTEVRDKYLAKLATSPDNSTASLPGWLERKSDGSLEKRESLHVPDFIPRSRSAVGD
jgi:hypothetical protein